MKKLTLLILIVSCAALLTWACSAYAAEILGYTMVPKQAKFYTIILGLIGASVGMASALYAALWLSDLREKRKARAIKPFGTALKGFGGEMAVAAQPAK